MRYSGNLPRTLDRSERGAKAVETAMLRQCGIGRDKLPSLGASRKPVDDYFEGFWVEGKPAVAGQYLDSFDVWP